MGCVLVVPGSSRLRLGGFVRGVGGVGKERGLRRGGEKERGKRKRKGRRRKRKEGEASND